MQGKTFRLWNKVFVSTIGSADRSGPVPVIRYPRGYRSLQNADGPIFRKGPS